MYSCHRIVWQCHVCRVSPRVRVRQARGGNSESGLFRPHGPAVCNIEGGLYERRAECESARNTEYQRRSFTSPCKFILLLEHLKSQLGLQHPRTAAVAQHERLLGTPPRRGLIWGFEG